MSEYNKLKSSGLGRGRPKLSAAEKEARAELTAIRQEARRRAHIVLQHKHAKEYNQIFDSELSVLSSKLRKSKNGK